MNVAVVGSSSFPLTPELGSEVVDLLRSYAPGTTFLTREKPYFDQFVYRAMAILGYTVVAYPSLGGPGNWDRDVALVHDADELVAFFDPATLDDMNTGTAHLVEKGLDKRKKVRAYTVANDHIVFAGET